MPDYSDSEASALMKRLMVGDLSSGDPCPACGGRWTVATDGIYTAFDCPECGLELRGASIRKTIEFRRPPAEANE